MKDSTKKLLLLGGIALFIVLIYAINGLTTADSYRAKYEGYDLTEDVKGAERKGTYSLYLSAHADAKYPQKNVEISVMDFQSGAGIEERSIDYGRDALYTESGSFVEWEVNIPESGFYNVEMEYMTVESRGVAAERAFYINGELPFDDAENMTFSRLWVDAGPVKKDNQGNEIRPTQIERFEWQSTYLKDDMGYISEPYCFYFEKGANKVAIKAVNEPLVIGAINIKGVEKRDTYEEYIAKVGGKEATGEGLSYYQQIQGEASTVRSDASLYAKYDRSSPTTQPNSVMKTLMNYTGGDSWRSSGQWIEWEFSVPEDGYYNISVKGRQNYQRGSVSSRSVYIDGEIPFSEVEAISFDYDNDWNLQTLADENGDPYKFYLKKGDHTIRLEATLGDMGPILEELENSTARLNLIYRKLLVYTGATPDKYRDYKIHQQYPEVITAMDLEAKRLYKIVDDVVAYTGQKADKIATAQTLAVQLERFVEKPEKITVEFANFKENVSALGTAILNMAEIKLDVDYLVVSGADAEVKKDKAGIFASIFHEIKSFFASFIVDYDAVGDVYEGSEGKDAIKVWVTTGRDQGTILKTMIDDTFTPETGIKVNVEIVNPGSLLNAVLAGRGPDVALSVGADQPVNYALRNAVEDLTQFDDIDEVLTDFSRSSYEQIGLDGALYGLPESQQFNVMFYRTDILEELGLEVPQTWQDLIEMLPTIQGNNMTVAIPTAGGSSASAPGATVVTTNNPDLTMYFTLLFQYGGDLYNEKGTRTVIDTEAGVEAFADYTKWFTDYGIPIIYDFPSRFRSGEMPIGIQSYTLYNTLVVSAPEIRGLWDFTVIPGTERVDENGRTYIDRSNFTSGSACMMIKTDDQNIRDNSWEFMKWWVSKDTQVRFGREIEALLGSSARYATANRAAMKELAWSPEEIEVLDEQWDWNVGIREVPGGYYTGRHISNACRMIMINHEDPRETILDYGIVINEELTKKRREFGLPTE